MKKPVVKAVRLHVRRGDLVKILSGDDKGKQGKVLEVLTGRGRAVVEGVNYVKRHMRKTQDNPKGGIVEKEAPVAVSKLTVVTKADHESEKHAARKS
jgi:large subunit ribosomal protein L24